LTITNAHIKTFKKSGFNSVYNENIKHIKVLPYLSIVQSVEGSYDIAIGSGETKQTGEGGFFIAPSEVQQTIVHHVNADSGKMSARWIFLDVEINNIYKIDTLYKFPAVIDNDLKIKFNKIFDSIFATNNIFDNYGDCYKLLGILLQISTPIEKEPHSGIKNAVIYIKENYSKNITIEKLAKLSHMSESNFYATFKKVFGNSPISYLNHYRLSIAAAKLNESDQSINEISSSVGITDPLYFSKLFKKTYGMSPKDYRRMYQTKT